MARKYRFGKGSGGQKELPTSNQTSKHFPYVAAQSKFILFA